MLLQTGLTNKMYYVNFFKCRISKKLKVESSLLAVITVVYTKFVL